MGEFENLENLNGETSAGMEAATEQIDSEKHELFHTKAKSRMASIDKQFTMLEQELAGSNKRSTDYTREDVEKIYAYFEERIARSRETFLERFNESKNNSFDFEF